MQSTILIAEDDVVARDLLNSYLIDDGYLTIPVTDGVSALRHLRENVDLAILDLGLPVIDGLNIVRTARREAITAPIIILTGRHDEADRLVSFEAGVDDYVTKPFHPREVLARVRAVLRRVGTQPAEGRRVISVGRFEVNEAAREVRVDGVDLRLRPREFDLFCALIASPGIAFSRRMLIERVWHDDYDGDDRTIDGHIRRIREKLERFPGAAKSLVTIYGIGYKFQIA